MSDYPEKPFEAFRVGDRATYRHTFSDADVREFARLSGDDHPAHREGDYARSSRWGRPVVHGLLTASLLSAANARLLGTPGSVSIEQTVKFLRPVFVGDTITATSEVIRIISDRRWLRCRTTCTNQKGELVLTGDALGGKESSGGVQG